MGLFTQFVDTKPSQVVKLGSTVRIPLTRDFPREGFIIHVSGTITNSASGNVIGAGLLDIVKRVRLVVNEGASNRTVLDADGLSILQRHINYNQSIDQNTLSAYRLMAPNGPRAGVGAFQVNIPHFFAPGALGAPTRDMFLQNFPRYNSDPVLEIQLASYAELDTSAGVQIQAADTTAVSVDVRVTDFKRNVDILDWNFLKVEFAAIQQTYPVTTPQSRYSIPIPGYHFSLGVRPYTNITTGTMGDITSAGGLIKIETLGQVERSTTFQIGQLINDLSDYPVYVGNSFAGTTAVGIANAIADSGDVTASAMFFDYLTDQTGSEVNNLDTLFNTNAFVNIGATPEVRWDVTGGANVAAIFMHDRCFGDITGALAKLRMMAARQKR